MTIMLWHHLDNQKPDTGVVHKHLLNTVKDTLYQIMDTMYPTNYHAISKRKQAISITLTYQIQSKPAYLIMTIAR